MQYQRVRHDRGVSWGALELGAFSIRDSMRPAKTKRAPAYEESAVLAS